MKCFLRDVSGYQIAVISRSTYTTDAFIMCRNDNRCDGSISGEYLKQLQTVNFQKNNKREISPQSESDWHENLKPINSLMSYAKTNSTAFVSKTEKSCWCYGKHKLLIIIKLQLWTTDTGAAGGRGRVEHFSVSLGIVSVCWLFMKEFRALIYAGDQNMFSLWCA